MRDIKFRAWNEDENAMTPVFEFPEPMQLMAQTAELLSKSPNFNHLVWQQYTGLKDKNGVEIYEGDIVLYKCETGGRLRGEEYREVKWRTASNYSGWNIAPGKNGSNWSVVGNIYENAELLK